MNKHNLQSLYAYFSPLDTRFNGEFGGQQRVTHTRAFSPASSRRWCPELLGKTSVFIDCPLWRAQSRMVLSRLLLAISVSPSEWSPNYMQNGTDIIKLQWF